MKRWWAILPLAIFIGLVVVGFQRLTGGDPAPTTFASPVRPAPQFDVPGLDGGQVKLSDFKGRPVLVNFWATWCPPCKEEMPEFSRLNIKYASNSVQFVGISIDSVDKVSAFRKENEISYPLLISNLETLDLSSDLGNRAKALPFTVILRGDGSPQQVKLGKFATPDLEKAIQTALQPR